MGSLYNNLTDHNLSCKIKAYEKRLANPEYKRKDVLIKYLKSLYTEKNKRLRKATMSIENLIN